MDQTSEYGAGGSAKEEGRKIAEEVKAGAREAVEAGKERTRTFLEEQKTTAAQQMEDLASMLRRAARDHEREGGRAASVQLAQRAADGMESIAESLQQRDLRGLVRGCEDFARRSPAVFVGGLATAGFLLARFLKSSSEPAESEGDRAPSRPLDRAPGTTGLGTTTYPTTSTTSPAGRAY